MIVRKPTALELRVAATQQLVDEWKGRPFDFKARSHCARMVADHLRRMGYKPPIAKAGQYATEAGALRALKRLGVKSLAEALDKMGLPRIPPAAALAGDVVEIPGEGALGCLTVAVGNGRTLGFHQDADGAAVMQPSQYSGAWRVDPRQR